MKKYNKDFYFYKKIDVRECSEKQKKIIINNLKKLGFRINFEYENFIKYLYVDKEKVAYCIGDFHYLTHPNLPISPKLFFTSFKDKLK